jgi:hypothetical protein
VLHFFARLKIYLQISSFGFSHKLLVFSIFNRENVKSELYTPLRPYGFRETGYLRFNGFYVLTVYQTGITGAGSGNPTHPKFYFETLLRTSKNKFWLLMRCSPGIGTTKRVLAGCSEVKSRLFWFVLRSKSVQHLGPF